MTARPAWTYEVRVDRVRHRRGYYFDEYALVRNDTKVIARNIDPDVLAKVQRRFEAWALQPWR